MSKKLILIYLGLIFLSTLLFVGTPFEFLNVTADKIATFIIIILFLFLFIVLFIQIWRLGNNIFRLITFGLLTIIAIPYFFIGIWNLLLTWSNYHPMWQDLYIYTNDKNEKVISQWRETSGSIYDYRDRKIIADYGQFRISLNCNLKNLEGVWTEYNIGKKKEEVINFENIED